MVNNPSYIFMTAKLGASVAELRNNPAIYLEPIGKIDIITSIWNLIDFNRIVHERK